MNYFFMVLLIIMGILCIVIPDKIVRFRHYFDLKGGTPTEEAILATRISSIAFFFFALMFYYI